MSANNPAGRLHKILTLCRDKKLNGLKMMMGWRAVLGLNDDIDDTIVMSKVGKVLILPQNIATRLKQYEDLDLDLYLGWQQVLSSAFQNINYQAHFGHFSDQLTNDLLTSIRFCDHELSKRHPEKIVEANSLEELKDAANRLYHDIATAKIDPHLARYMLDHLYMIIEAIDDYLINGSSGLKTALDAIVGTVVTSASVAKAARESSFGQKFWEIAAKIALTMELAKAAKEIGDGFTELLK